MASLDNTTLDALRAQIGELMSLYPNISYRIEIATKTRGLLNIKAPHYLIFSSEENEGYLENIGFIGQQLDLFLPTMGLGACWLGAAKPTDGVGDSGLPHVICMGFGRPNEPLFREVADFKRKPLVDISEGNDPRLDAARLAPSGLNSQNWYFIADEGKIHCYRKKGVLFGKMASIDLGIAICHLWLAGTKSADFAFVNDSKAPTKKGYIYSGSTT